MNKELSELSAEILGLKVRDFFYTFWSVIRRPGQTARNYCEGKDSRLIPPVVYSSTLFFLLFCLDNFSGLSDYYLLELKNLSRQINDEQFKNYFWINHTIASSFSDDLIRNLIWLPVLTICVWVYGRPFVPRVLYNFYYVVFVYSTYLAISNFLGHFIVVTTISTIQRSKIIALLVLALSLIVSTMIMISLLFSLLKFYNITFKQSILRSFNPIVLIVNLVVPAVASFIIYKILS
jgi:hypothetical protein